MDLSSYLYYNLNYRKDTLKKEKEKILSNMCEHTYINTILSISTSFNINNIVIL